MAAVIGTENNTVADGRAGDEQVTIAYNAPRFPKAASLLPEQITDRFIEREHNDTGKKLLKRGHAPAGVARIVDALIEFSQRNDADGEAFRLQFLELLRDGRNAAEMVNDPVGVDEIGGTGHVRTRRAAAWSRGDRRRYSA